MARTVKEIKDQMTATFCKERAVIAAYGLNPNKSFDQQFSAASIESILFYVFAFAVWVLETLFDKHAAEVDTRIELLEPHTLRWYVDKAKAFMYGYRLVTDSDYYDTTGMSETDIEAARVVKFANATESNTVVYLKVAGINGDGNPVKLSDSQFSALRSYIDTVKDAGVSVVLRNEAADVMKMQLVVHYNPMLADRGCEETGYNKDVNDTILKVITGLPFNGVFRTSDLVSALSELPLVEAVDIVEIQAKASDATDWHYITGGNLASDYDPKKPSYGLDRPYSGYYSIESSDITAVYVPYNDVVTDNVQSGL